MTDNPDPPVNDPPANDPTANPDANGAAELARLQGQVEAATGSVQKALDTTKGALRTANPNLPDTVFEAPDLDALIANVEAHKATAAHVQEQITSNPPNPTAPVSPAGGGTTRQVQVPENVHGISRISFALSNPGPGMTE